MTAKKLMLIPVVVTMPMVRIQKAINTEGLVNNKRMDFWGWGLLLSDSVVSSPHVLINKTFFFIFKWDEMCLGACQYDLVQSQSITYVEETLL